MAYKISKATILNVPTPIFINNFTPVDSWRTVAIVFITEKAILAMNGPQITNPDVEIIK